MFLKGVLEVLQGMELFVASIASPDYTALARRRHRPNSARGQHRLFDSLSSSELEDG